MKKLLVISENVGLCKYLDNTLHKQGLTSNWQVDYRYSAANPSPEDMVAFGAQEIDVTLSSTVQSIISHYDICFSLHCKQIFPEILVHGIPCFNFHPGYIPHNRGWYPQAFSLINRLPIGATIHKMGPKIDHSDIVAQQQVDILPTDTSQELYDRVIEAEKNLICEYLRPILAGKVNLEPLNSMGNYNSIKDYENLCHLDLNNVDTLENHLNHLRALSHGEYKNAYFIKDGKKYYVSVLLSEA